MSTAGTATAHPAGMHRREDPPRATDPGGRGTLAPLLRPFARRHRRLLGFAAAAMVGEVVAGLLMPWPLKWIVDSVLFAAPGTVRTSLGPAQWWLVGIISGVALLVAAAQGIFGYLQVRLTSVVAARTVLALRAGLFAHLQRLSLSFHQHQDTRVGDLLSRLGSDVQAIEDLAESGVSTVVTHGMGLVASIGVMFWLDWRLAAVVTVLTVPLFVVTERITTRMRRALRRARRQAGRVGSVMAEALGAVKLVQSYGREDHEDGRLAVEAQVNLDATLEATAMQARLAPTVTVLSTVATVVVTGYGVALVVGGSITAGTLLVFLGYLRGLQAPVRQLAKLSFALGKAGAGAERISQVLAQEPALADRPDAVAVGAVRGAVSFDDVVFGHQPGRPLLRGISIEAAPGQTVAVIGSTGAGKSTLMSLLPRFHDPWAGTVRLDGHDLRDLTLASVRAAVAVVLQDNLIFHGTLRDNIAYGRLDATEDEIEEAAEAAGVGPVIRRLPDGLATLVSERGTSLSGGEKQCVGIARAILKDAPVLILDEPTSAMDSLTERRVLDGLERLMVGRTTFVIAHRLATIRRADAVVVLEHGQVVEHGRPEQLLRTPQGRFATMARAQAMGPEQGALRCDL